MSLKLNAPGGGSVTLQEPTTASNVTLNLPAANGTVVFENASGNVGIGESSPSSRLHIADGSGGGAGRIRMSCVVSAGYDSRIFQDDTGLNFSAVSDSRSLVFRTGNSDVERARIDGSGNLLVGFSGSTSARLFVEQAVNDHMTRFHNSQASGVIYGPLIRFTGQAPNSVSSEFLACLDTGAYRMVVRSNGGIANFSGNNVNLSDRREKTNFAPAKSYLDTICAIPVQTFNYIDQNMEDDPGLTLGVVAQDVQAVAPELVMESNWGTKDDPKMRLSIYQTDLQYALMKALQELKAEFDAYKASHP